MIRILPAMALLVLSSCRVPGGGVGGWGVERFLGKDPGYQSGKGPVEDTILEMHASYGRGDLDRVGRMLTPGATCYNAHTGELHSGRDSIIGMFRAMLEHRKGRQPAASTMADMEIRMEGRFALATYRFIEVEDGRESVSIITHTLQRRERDWVTTHLHWSSVPKR